MYDILLKYDYTKILAIPQKRISINMAISPNIISNHKGQTCCIIIYESISGSDKEWMDECCLMTYRWPPDMDWPPK